MKKIIAVAVVLVLAGVSVELYRTQSTAADQVADAKVTAAVAVGTADADAIKRGQYVARVADCAACHTAPGSLDAMAGGYPMNTPFGVIYSSNITPDPATGIGSWTERDFFEAVRHGRGKDGLLYSAMPYPSYVKLSDQDMHDLWAYFRTIKPVQHRVDATKLPFPFNIRSLMLGWNLLFFKNQAFQPEAGKSEAYTRGQYLVDGAGHCAACHSPKNALGGDASGKYLQGGTLQGWYAPDLTGNHFVGLGDWSSQDIADYLKIGSNRQSVASGPMAEAVENSTQYLTAEDLAAVATYLKALPASAGQAPPALAADDSVMKQGAVGYEVNCSACHGPDGSGIAGMAPAFANNPSIRSHSGGNMIRTALLGGRAAATENNPTAAGMPSFDWKLSDQQLAAILSYVRNSWGNAAAPITATEVAASRKALQARQPMSAQ